MKKTICIAMAALLMNLCVVPVLAAEPSLTSIDASARVALDTNDGRLLPPKRAPKPKTAESDDAKIVDDANTADDSWMLQLVNREHSVAADFVTEFEEIKNGFVMDKRVAPMARQMLADAHAAGVGLVINSAYRPYSSQQRIYNAKIQQYLSLGYSAENAKTRTELYIAIPGHSEHQIGLAVDIVTPSYQMLDSGYSATDAAKWLAANAPSYGFILRYPADKTEITHIAFEPWHFRYVGEADALAITEQGLCLEEYLAKRESGNATKRGDG